MKVEKLKIGQIYYMSSCSMHSYKKVTLLEIIDSKHVLLKDRKNRTFIGKNARLYKTPDKAVVGRKRQEALRRQMNKEKRRKPRISCQ